MGGFRELRLVTERGDREKSRIESSIGRKRGAAG